MRIPGYTAEDSVYRTMGRYRTTAGARNGWGDGQEILPQLPKQLLLCLRDCQFNPDPDFEACREVCYWNHFTEGGGLGGGGGTKPKEPPELVCGPCRNGRQLCRLPGVGSSYSACTPGTD